MSHVVIGASEREAILAIVLGSPPDVSRLARYAASNALYAPPTRWDERSALGAFVLAIILASCGWPT